VAWATTAPANPDLLVPFVVRLFEPLSVTDDRSLATKWATPREQLQRDLGHPDVGFVFCLWQCDKENHCRREGPPQTVHRVAGLYPPGKLVSNEKRILSTHQPHGCPQKPPLAGIRGNIGGGLCHVACPPMSHLP
jgi:hypothetical protein